jgi:phytoene/squalene synthetase
LPVDHYENFPVASWLLPRRLRAPIEAIYGFARSADDIADEGHLPDAQRLKGLDRHLAALDAIEAGKTPETQFAPIGRAIAEYELPIALLRDLIDAFRQDVVKKRYADFTELMDYARRSANPIGRLLLNLFEKTGDRPRFSRGREAPPKESVNQKTVVCPRFSVEQSDAICSGLQIINFWQDVAVDWEKGRVYIPQEDLARFGVEERAIAAQRADANWRDLMAFECQRARAMLLAGAPLGRSLPGRLGLEIRATIAGGAAILDKIDAVAGDVFRHRPVLTPFDWIKILGKVVPGTTFPDP